MKIRGPCQGPDLSDGYQLFYGFALLIKSLLHKIVPAFFLRAIYLNFWCNLTGIDNRVVFLDD